MKDARVQHLRDAIEGELNGLYVDYDVAQRIMQHIDASIADTAVLQDLGYELGCPAGIKTIDWLRVMVRKAQRAEVSSIADTAGAKPEPVLTLSGAQLLEAFHFVAPDYPNDPDQLECEVTFAYGDGHDGEGAYCWITDYPDEGSMLLDGSTAASIVLAAPPAPSVADADFKNFHRLLCERFGYEHDEEHWKRDQLSLIEHLAWGRCITTPSQEEKRSESIDCGECACLPGFCDKEGEVRSVLRMIVEKINAEGPASRDWQGFTHLCELAEQLLAAPSVADAAGAVERMETTSEHIARDIREGRFPKRSEPQMVGIADTAGAKEDGWKLVPVTPTEAMVRAACLKQSNAAFESYEAWHDSHSSGISARIRQLVASDYRVMIAAAPPAPSVDDAKCMCSGLGPCEKLSNCRKAPSVADAECGLTEERKQAIAASVEQRYGETIRNAVDSVADAAGASENDVARVIFSNLFPRGMCPSDWDSGAILGPNNETREQFLQAARAVIAAIEKECGK